MTEKDALDLVRTDVRRLADVPEDLKTEAVCLATAGVCGGALRFAPDAAKTPAVCMAAVRQDGMALRHVPWVRKTPEICMAAVLQNPMALKVAHLARQKSGTFLRRPGASGLSRQALP